MLNKYLPGILMGLGIGGLISSTFVAFELAPMVRDAVEEKKQELNVEKLSPKDAIATIWPYILPSAILRNRATTRLRTNSLQRQASPGL